MCSSARGLDIDPVRAVVAKRAAWFEPTLPQHSAAERIGWHRRDNARLGREGRMARRLCAVTARGRTGRRSSAALCRWSESRRPSTPSVHDAAVIQHVEDNDLWPVLPRRPARTSERRGRERARRLPWEHRCSEACPAGVGLGPFFRIILLTR